MMTVVVGVMDIEVATVTVAGSANLIVAAGRIGKGNGTAIETVELVITEKQGEEEGMMTMMADSSAALKGLAPLRLRGTPRIATAPWLR